MYQKVGREGGKGVKTLGVTNNKGRNINTHGLQIEGENLLLYSIKQKTKT